MHLCVAKILQNLDRKCFGMHITETSLSRMSCSHVRPVHDKQRAVRNFLLASIILFFSPIWPIKLRTVQCYLNLQDLSSFSSVTYWAPLLLVYLLNHPWSEAVEMPGWKTGIASYPGPLGTRLRQALTQCVFTANHPGLHTQVHSPSIKLVQTFCKQRATWAIYNLDIILAHNPIEVVHFWAVYSIACLYVTYKL